MLSISPHDNPWHNAVQPTDVNHDGYTSPLDALAIFNQIDRGHSGALPIVDAATVSSQTGVASDTATPIYPDVNNDGILSPLDALIVFNYLDVHPASSSTTNRVAPSVATIETPIATAAQVAVTIQSVTNPVTAANQTNTSASGTGPVGATIQLAASDPGFAHVSSVYSTVVAGDGTWSITSIDVSTLDDGPIDYGAADAADLTNFGVLSSYKAAATSITAVTDPVNLANVTATAVSGTGKPGDQLSISASDLVHTTVPSTVTVAASGLWSATNMDVSALDDGTIIYSATIVGTTAQFSIAAFKDTIAPTVSVTSVTDPITSANAANTSISGTGEVGAHISVVAVDGTQTTVPKTATVAADGLWSISGIDVTALLVGPIAYTATATDDFGNSATSAKTSTKVPNSAPTVSIDNVAIDEGNVGARQLTFTVTLSAPSSAIVDVDYYTVDGTATAGVDYFPKTGTLVFQPSETSKTISVDVIGDTIYELDESFFIVLTEPGEVETEVVRQGTGTILNDDAPPAIVISDAEPIVEGDTGDKQMLFAVTLSAASGIPVTFDFGPANFSFAPPAVIGDDYDLASGTFTLQPGQTLLTLSVTIHGDHVNEDDEFVTVEISNVNGATPSDQTFASGQILNDDLSTVSISDAQVVEGDAGVKAMQFTVTLSKPSDAPITVDFATTDGTALAGQDYTAASSTLTFDPQQTTKTITIDILGDTLVEPTESFQVVLSNVAGRNASIDKSTGVGTIIDNDSSPEVSISISNALPVVEGNSGITPMTFTVQLSAPSEKQVTVQYATSAGTAAEGVDYQAAQGTLTFAPGEITKTISVDVIGDTLKEPNETLFLNLQNPTNAVLSSSQAVGTIRDDDQSCAGFNLAFGAGWIAFMDQLLKDGYCSHDPVFASGANFNSTNAEDGITIFVGGFSFATGF